MAEIGGDLRFGILGYDDKPMLMENLTQIHFSLWSLSFFLYLAWQPVLQLWQRVDCCHSRL
ncbi:hypothetical protein Hanom_Chr05g00456731 [Helianthus anomalus]